MTTETTLQETTFPGEVLEPAVDIYEADGVLTLLADMPGVAPDDVNIDLNENVLTLSGTISTAELNDDEEVHTAEFGLGTYERRFRLAKKIDQDRIEASLKDGVLELRLPMAEKTGPRRIAISHG